MRQQEKTPTDYQVAASRATKSVPASCHVYTPPSLAGAIVRALRPRDGGLWLEPCVGGGALLSAIHATGVSSKQVHGLDLVDMPGPLDNLGRIERGIEFLAWARTSKSRYDYIVANPPYARLTSCSRAIRGEAAWHGEHGRLPVPGIANLWYAFVVASLGLLRDDGSIAFILPASFEYAGYASKLRAQLPSLFAKTVVLRSRTSLFRVPPVEGGAVVLLGLKARHSGETTPSLSERREVGDLEGMVRALEQLAAGVAESKGEAVRRVHVVPGPQQQIAYKRLAELATVSIGAVTGDSKYFLMTDARRDALKLPVSACKMVVSRRQHLAGGRLNKDTWAVLRDDGERIWLFHPSRAAVRAGPACSYIRRSVEKGGCHKDGYKVSGRDPWYQTVLPKKVQALVSPAVDRVPHVALVNGGIAATNTLYVLSFKGPLTLSQRASVLLSLFLPRALESLDRSTRQYVGGLRKIEPGELGAIEVRVPTGACRGAVGALQRAMKAVANGDERGAREAANLWFTRHDKVVTESPRNRLLIKVG